MLPQTHYDPPGVKIGKKLAKLCVFELEFIQYRKAKSEILLPMVNFLLARNKNTKGTPTIRN